MVDPESGDLIQTLEFEGGQGIVGPVFGSSRIVVPTPAGKLLAFDVAGNLTWERDLAVPLEESPTLAMNTLLVPSSRGRALFSVSLPDGLIRWKAETEFEPNSVPAVDEGIVVLTTEHIGSDRAHVLALDADDGQQIWKVPQKEGYGSPAIMDGKVILGGGDFQVHALDLKTGRSLWRSRVEGKFGPRNLPALAYGDAFFADRIGNIYRFDGSTGKRLWKFSETEGTFDQSSPIVVGKTLYIGSGAGWLYALDVDDGRLLWKHQVGGFIYFGAADSERIYFGVKNRNEGLYAFEHDPNGKLIEEGISPGSSLIGGVILFGLIGGGVILFARRRRRSGSTIP